MAFNSELLGHEGQIGRFTAALSSGRLHHGWLLTGPKSLGKATFAQSAAEAYLCETLEPDSHTRTMVREGNHPDLRILEPGPKDDAAHRKMQDGQPFERSRNIRVDQIRKLQQSFGFRPTLSDRRVVIIDSADLLERSAANALLKSLEEPPANTLFLIVAHNPGALLPTIRSRCLVLTFAPPAPQTLISWLKSRVTGTNALAIEKAAELSGGAPGRAMDLLNGDAASLTETMWALAEKGDADRTARTELASSFSGKANRESLVLALDIAPLIAHRIACAADGVRRTAALAAWTELNSLAERAPTANFEPQVLGYHIGGLLAGLAPPR